MRFTITSQGAGMPLQLDISGYILTVSDISEHSISVSDTDGRLAVLSRSPVLSIFLKWQKERPTGLCFSR